MAKNTLVSCFVPYRPDQQRHGKKDTNTLSICLGNFANLRYSSKCSICFKGRWHWEELLDLSHLWSSCRWLKTWTWVNMLDHVVGGRDVGWHWIEMCQSVHIWKLQQSTNCRLKKHEEPSWRGRLKFQSSFAWNSVWFFFKIWGSNPGRLKAGDILAHVGAFMCGLRKKILERCHFVNARGKNSSQNCCKQCIVWIIWLETQLLTELVAASYSRLLSPK